jgi:hypothetical protein
MNGNVAANPAGSASIAESNGEAEIQFNARMRVLIQTEDDAVDTGLLTRLSLKWGSG